MFVDNSFVDFFATISQHSELPEADYTTSSKEVRYASGMDYAPCNGIFAKDPNASISEEEIEAQIQYFHQKKLPFVWWSNAPILAHKGFIFGGVMKGIMVDLCHSSAQGESLMENQMDNLKIRQATSDSDIRVFSQLLAQGLGLETHLIEQFYSVNKTTFQAGKQIHYLAHYHHIPVSTISLSFHGEATGLWNGVTLPEYRRRGILTTLIQHALQETRARNISKSIAILMPKGMASGPTQKCGFKEVCDYPFYIYGSHSLE